MLGKIFESLYLKVLINIVVQRTKTVVHIELCSKKDVKDEVSLEFNTTKLSEDMHNFIYKYIKECKQCNIK